MYYFLMIFGYSQNGNVIVISRDLPAVGGDGDELQQSSTLECDPPV